MAREMIEPVREMAEMGLLGAAAAVFFLSVGVYVLLMIFLPEWVGITGKVALENERSHRGTASEADSVNAASASSNEAVPPADKPGTSAD
ncbi:MAG: hypothetical protein NDI61_07380 [Bdellovibrionaceae bacterium]|nr:hypothetical protein [Pseudobdellovibrionaceae bacterium]